MRAENWPELLAEFIESRRLTPFVRGVSDCTMFAADAIKAMTGVDPAEQYRGTYSDTKGALRLIQGAGGIANLVPFAPIAVVMAGRGDLVMIETEEGESLAMHLGRVIAAQGIDGIEFIPVSRALAAWRVE